ncbi:hypothetical protein AK830_g12547 [Neonectria ditissima]|uniref:Uncharacterized protein n=1 Tax=Neonectria ditissima TaxID=78410 RepID=A0A0P7B0B0_9HYPO|nr:hypothetical protein AK830_g12547 [Neonectria ditissima]
MDPDSLATDDAHVDAEDDIYSDDDQALMAQALGFASFGAQGHLNKKRRYNPRADATLIAGQKPSVTGANSTALGPAPIARSNADEISLDDDGDDESALAPTQVRPASLPQRPAVPPGGSASREQAHFQSNPHRSQDPSRGPWYEGYYDPMSNENPWDRIEKTRGISSVGTWLPRGGAVRPSTTATPA